MLLVHFNGASNQSLIGQSKGQARQGSHPCFLWSTPLDSHHHHQYHHQPIRSVVGELYYIFPALMGTDTQNKKKHE